MPHSQTRPRAAAWRPNSRRHLALSNPHRSHLNSSEETQRLLEEALAGIDREFTPEEAERILDLLREENRRSVEDSAAGPNAGELPDY